jgi:hypothetical protein
MSLANDHYPDAIRAVRTRKRDSLIANLRAALEAHPPEGVREVRLFGSWARGNFDGSSDVDLLVVTEDECAALDVRPLPKAERIDVVNVPHEELARYVADDHPFYAKAMREGVVVFTS